MTNEPRDWWDTVDLDAPDWWDTLGKPQYEEPVLKQPTGTPTFGKPGWVPATLKQPAPAVSKAARALKATFPWHSRKPSGAERAGQRSAARMVPAAGVPVDPMLVLGVFQRRWRGKLRVTLPWRKRGLAVIAVAMSVPPYTTSEAMAGMLPREVLGLRMPSPAWRWVCRWLATRRAILGPASDNEPWGLFCGSNGRPRQLGWSATRTLDRAGLPGWRLGALLKASWYLNQEPVPFTTVAGRLLDPGSAFWPAAS